MEREGREKERAFSHWLCNIEGIGRNGQRRLLERAGSARGVYELKEKELPELLSQRQQEAFLAAQRKKAVLEEYRSLTARGILYLPAADPLFPERLREIPDPPVGIYVWGRLPEEDRPAVAVIGARECSEYGRYAARRFAGILAGQGVAIISGLARGIDGIGQEAALAQGGETYAVMGCGVDVCYPKENRRLYERIKRQGGILSEYPPGTAPVAGLFPQRNRIISALADVVLVIEAREKSGTLITVDMALEQGREVAVVPGRITDRLSLGCNRLIRQGAAAALTPEDVLELLGPWKGRETAAALTPAAGPEKPARETIPARNVKAGQTTAPGKAPGPYRESICRAEGGPSLLWKEGADLAAVPLKTAVFYALDFTPQSVGQVCEALERRGRKTCLQEVMHSLMELLLEGKCMQEAGFYSLTSNS